MKFLPHLFLMFFGLISCNNPTVQLRDVTKELKEEVINLKTVESQKTFLETILEIDQKVRTDSKDALQKYGYESDEVLEANQKMMSVDEENIMKIEQYLEIHGHPTIDKHGKDAAMAPWVVIHHVPECCTIRETNFKYLYEAMKKEDLDDGAFRLYLYRWNKMKFGNEIEWDRPFKPQEDIDTLVKVLNLQKFVTEVDQKLKEEI